MIASLTSILVSRFLLRLQVVNEGSRRGSSALSGDTEVGSIMFQRVVGSIGTSILESDYGVSTATRTFPDSSSTEADTGTMVAKRASVVEATSPDTEEFEMFVR